MQIKYRPEIDGLRTVAVMSVLVYHAEFSIGSGLFLNNGFLGVDVFFVISGFLITSLIIKEHHHTGRFSFLRFYERRSRRLLPALLAVMLFSIPLAWSILLPTQLVDFAKSLIASLTFASNLYWHGSLQEYGAESALFKPFLNTWSLAVEEQFYLAFPVVLLALYRWWKTQTLAVLGIAFIASLTFASWASVKHQSFSFYMLPSRFWELLVGALIAHVLYLYPTWFTNFKISKAMPAIGLFLITVSLISFDFSQNHPGLVTLVPVIGTALVICFSNERDVVTRILSSKPMVGVGLISYSLYLWHYPVFAFSRLTNLSPTFYDKVLWIAVAILASIATYFLIEKPFRHRAVISLKALVLWAGLVATVVVAFAIYAISEDGRRERFPGLVKVYGQNEFDNPTLETRSWNLLTELATDNGFTRSLAHAPSAFEAKQRWFTDNTETKKVLIVGNSHSKDLFNALIQNQEKFPRFEFARFGMKDSLPKDQIDELLISPNLAAADVVLISFRYEFASIERLPTLISSLRERAKLVAIASNTVEFNSKEQQPLFDWYAQHNFKTFSESEMNRIFFENKNNRHQQVNRELKKYAEDENLLFFDKGLYMCDSAAHTCDGVTREGYKSFYDDAHYTQEGAKHFGERIFESGWLDPLLDGQKKETI